MSRFDSDTTADYALSISKNAMRKVQSVNSLIHAPCVASAIAGALGVITVLEV